MCSAPAPAPECSAGLQLRGGGGGGGGAGDTTIAQRYLIDLLSPIVQSSPQWWWSHLPPLTPAH